LKNCGFAKRKIWTFGRNKLMHQVLIGRRFTPNHNCHFLPKIRAGLTKHHRDPRFRCDSQPEVESRCLRFSVGVFAEASHDRSVMPGRSFLAGIRVPLNSC
jgi:hypothetical protein